MSVNENKMCVEIAYVPGDSVKSRNTARSETNLEVTVFNKSIVVNNNNSNNKRPITHSILRVYSELA
jgi:hypothetical protein